MNKRHGFTLIEGIIAIGVIGTALIVGLALAVSNFQAAQLNSDRVIAIHLAREGVEAVRAMRDSNWMRRDENIDKDSDLVGLQFYNWNDFFDGWSNISQCASPPCEGNYFDLMLNDYNLAPTNGPLYTLRKETNAANNDVLACISNGDTSCRIQKKGGVFFQSVDTPTVTGGAFTNMYRRIILKPVCLFFDGSNYELHVDFDSGSPDVVCDSGTLEGMLVTSHVMWQRNNKTLEVKVKERLYNWRS